MKQQKIIWRVLVFSLFLFLAVPVVFLTEEPIQAEAAPKLSKKKAVVKEGKTITLNVKNLTGGGKVQWKSSNPKIVKVTKQTGVNKSKATLKGMAAGTATVTAKVEGKNLKAKVTVKHVHKWRGYATCTQPDLCTECGAGRGIALGHSFSPATCQHAATCQRCGAKQGGLGPHTWDSNEICTVCNTLNMPRLLQMEITNAAQGTTDRVRVAMNNIGRQQYRLPYTSQSVPFPATLTTNGRAYSVYLLGQNGWQYTDINNALNDNLVFAIESTNQNDFFTVTFNATLVFDIEYFNQRTTQYDRYSVTVTPSGSTFVKK